MKVEESERTRQLILRAASGDTLPTALLRVLAEERVRGGWLRAQGVLAEVELRGFAGKMASLLDAKRLPGTWRMVWLEGSVGLAGREPSIGLWALLARDTERGLEQHAGEIVAATVVTFEAVLVAFDDLEMPRERDTATGVWGFAPVPLTAFAPAAPTVPRDVASRVGPRSEPAMPAVKAPAATADDPWSAAAFASAREDARAARAANEAAEPVPRAGDVVFHFAFGRCDVIRGDEDRLKLKVHKDGRIREIALDVLSVRLLDEDGKRRSFRLDRKA